MSERRRCQCSPSCGFDADPGYDHCLAHDPSDERAEQRRQMLAERGRKGAAKMRANRQATRDSLAVKLSVRTTEGQLEALDVFLRNLARSKLDAAKVAAAGAQLIKVAREVLAADELQAENRDLRQLIAERFPDLKKHLKAVP